VEEKFHYRGISPSIAAKIKDMLIDFKKIPNTRNYINQRSNC